MVALNPPLCNFGWRAVDFSLPATDGKSYTLASLNGENGLLIMFICNHCPFVKSIVTRLVEDCRQLQLLKIGVGAIMSNDVMSYPEDSFDNMKIFGQQNNFTFPYLFDETQSIARDYGAVCTPDFFGFNRGLELQYRGRFDEGRTSPPPAGAKRDLYDAMAEIAKTGKGPEKQYSSMGCSIKWC